MSARLKRRVALLLFAVLAFTQVNVGIAACPMSGGVMLSGAMAADMPCGDCDLPSNALERSPSLCAAQCGSEAQPAAASAPLVVPANDIVVLVLHARPGTGRPRGLDGPPSAAPPHRILTHSFLI